MTTADLREALDALERLPFPPAPDGDDELDDWWAELHEVDGFYAGIAHTVLGGGAVEYPLDEIDGFIARLERVQRRTHADVACYRESLEYARQLRRVRDALLPFRNRLGRKADG